MPCIGDVLFAIVRNDLVRGDIVNLTSHSHCIRPVRFYVVNVAAWSEYFILQSLDLLCVRSVKLLNRQTQSAYFLL